MTVGRPRIFNEDELPRDDATLLGIFDAGVESGRSAREMSSLIAWLTTPHTPSDVTVAKYRRILAELVPNGRPRSRSTTVRRGLAAIALLASAGAAAHEITTPEPVRASTVPAAAIPDPGTADNVRSRQLRRRRRNRGPSADVAGAGRRTVAASVRTGSTSERVADAHAMAVAA